MKRKDRGLMAAAAVRETYMRGNWEVAPTRHGEPLVMRGGELIDHDRTPALSRIHDPRTAGSWIRRLAGDRVISIYCTFVRESRQQPVLKTRSRFICGCVYRYRHGLNGVTLYSVEQCVTCRR